MRRLLSSFVVLWLATGCTVALRPLPVRLVTQPTPPPPPPPPPAHRATPVPPVPPPPPAPRLMSYNEAVSLGLQYCQGRGYGCQVKEAHMTGKRVWKVKLRVAGGLKGHVHLDYDAYSRTLLQVNEKVKERRGRHDRGDD